ncbi:MAG TPA: helicase HerA-like domain-containing protein [Candidatus Nitrosopolaris sp.]|nr:helicase HerA-like domain-containing protein [Candidatus Nitrosopolaris sp.]
MDAKLLSAVRSAFGGSVASVTLGAPVHQGECAPEPLVRLPIAMMNRHGLIAGATGTGKTKTLQLIAEQLSAAGVPVFLADLKGDVSGIGAPGESRNAGYSAPAPRRGKEPPSTLEQVLKSPVARTVAGVITRGVMGALLGTRRR